MTRATVLTALMAAACAPTTGSVTEGPTLPGEPLELPVEPVEAFVPGAWMDSPGPEPGELATASATLTLGIGPGYASEVEIEGVELWQGRCAWEGTWTVESVDSSEPDAIAARVRGDRLHVEVLAPTQTATLTVRGTWDGGCAWEGSAQGQWDMVQSYTVHAFEPAGAVLERPYACSGDDAPAGALLMDGQHALGRRGTFDTLRVLPVDADGNAREVANAHFGRQVALTLEPSEGVSTTLTPRPSFLPEGQEPDPVLGLSEAVFSGSGTVALSTPTGPLPDLRIATLEEVTDLDMAVVIPFGQGGDDLVLEDGATIDWSDVFQLGDLRHAQVIADRPRVDDTLACSKPDPAWFDVRTDPDLEAVDNEYGHATYDWTPVDERRVLDGVDTVRFSLDVPEADGGAGLGLQTQVTFVE